MLEKLSVRRAKKSEIKAIALIYDEVCEYLESHINYPGWHKGVYPTIYDAIRAYKDGVLYVALSGKEIVGTFIMRHEYCPNYDKVNWGTPDDYNKISVIHTLAVSLKYQHMHIGDFIMDEIVKISKKQGMVEIRLDLYQDNTLAEKMYIKHGFTYKGSADLGYAKYGLYNFRLYQFIL